MQIPLRAASHQTSHRVTRLKQLLKNGRPNKSRPACKENSHRDPAGEFSSFSPFYRASEKTSGMLFLYKDAHGAVFLEALRPHGLCRVNNPPRAFVIPPPEIQSAGDDRTLN
jgi:hypothetical protein